MVSTVQEIIHCGASTLRGSGKLTHPRRRRLATSLRRTPFSILKTHKKIQLLQDVVYKLDLPIKERADMKRLGLWIYDAYQYIFDSTKNPLRHIPDPVSRMFIMNILALMWSGAFGLYIGSIAYFGISLAAHIVLILMFFFTVAIFYDAEKNQSSWLLKLRNE